ncbi:MAG: response regulator [Phenylobacterium sp.]
MSGNRILVVDRNHVCTLVACEVFAEHGFEAIEAHSGAEALAAIDRGQPLAALVTAVALPAGPDGFAVARHARAAYPPLQVVYVSGVDPARHAAEGVAGSVLIPKPFDPRAVIAALGRAAG